MTKKPKKRSPEHQIQLTPPKCQTKGCAGASNTTFCDQCWKTLYGNPKTRAAKDRIRSQLATEGERDRSVKFDSDEEGPW